jgi:hypothetical protein
VGSKPSKMGLVADKIKYPWQRAIVDAFLAPPSDLSGKINIAERAISARLRESSDLDFEERIALNDGLRALHVLMSELRAKKSEEKRDKEPGEKKDTA